MLDFQNYIFFLGNEGRFQVILKAIELSTVSHDSCQSALRNTRLGKYFKLHESFICAGGTSDADTCTVRIILLHKLIFNM
jgi:hypothetical protein